MEDLLALHRTIMMRRMNWATIQIKWWPFSYYTDKCFTDFFTVWRSKPSISTEDTQP